QADQDSGEVLSQEMNDVPQTPDVASFLPQLTAESPFTMQPEPQAALETEFNVSVAETEELLTEEPLGFDSASAFNLNLSAEPAQVLPVDCEADTAPLSSTPKMEEMSEVLDLDNDLPSAPIQGDELELLPEIA